MTTEELNELQDKVLARLSNGFMAFDEEEVEVYRQVIVDTLAVLQFMGRLK